MPDRIDAAVEPMQAPGAQAPRDTALIDSGHRELVAGDDPVLLTRDQRDSCVGCGAFLSHSESKAPQPTVSPPSAPNAARGSAHFAYAEVSHSLGLS